MKSKILILFIVLLSCQHQIDHLTDVHWSIRTKNLIMNDSKFISDTAVNWFYSDTRDIYNISFFENKKNQYSDFLIKTFKKNSNKLIEENRFSKNKRFKLQRLYCDNGQLKQESIWYLSSSIESRFHQYGLFTEWYCNGTIKEQGQMFKNIKIGIWKKWNSSGELIDSIDFQKQNYIKLLDKIN